MPVPDPARDPELPFPPSELEPEPAPGPKTEVEPEPSPDLEPELRPEFDDEPVTPPMGPLVLCPCEKEGAMPAAGDDP